MHAIDALEIEGPTKTTLKDGVADSLRTAILTRQLKSGERIPESRMASKLGVSRAPVREALAVLQQEGLLTRDQRGVVVAEMSPTDIEEVCSLRLALESLGVREVIRNATPSDFELLEENIRLTLDSTEIGVAGQRDLEFHELLVRAARHERLLKSWLSLRSQIMLMLVQVDINQAEFARTTAANHRELLDVIRRGDEAQTVSLLERQLAGTRSELLGVHRNDSGD